MATETDVKPETDTPELPRTKEKLEELSSAAALQYSLKNFPAAAESYAYASEIQAELNGDMAPENAELLFYYGRALYKVAMSKTDVLGNKVAQEEKKKPKAKQEVGESSSASANGTAKKEETTDSKPYFQLTGDENWDDSEDEEDAEDGEGDAQEDDDFQNAYETFEIARVCYEKQLESLEAGDGTDKGKGKAELSPQARSIKEKIADCHGFLAEISLENERFQDAVFDARKALALQEELHPVEHENVSEAHYWLSLSLELASVHKVRQDQTGQSGDGANGTDATNDAEEQEIDYELRDEAAKHTELAIASVEARLKKEKTALGSTELTLEEKKEKEAIIKNKTEALGDLKARLVELKTDPKSQVFDSLDPTVFQGLLGGILGADAATQKVKLAEATASANDISGLVKTRKKEKPATPAPSTSTDTGSGKRKLDVEEDGANGKRAKTEEIS